MAKLVAYSWPGNVRELQTVLRTAMLKASGPVLVPELLPDAVNSGIPSQETAVGKVFLPSSLEDFIDERERAGSHNLYNETLEIMERYLLTRVLCETDGNQSKAAEQLGITRGSLRNKIHSLGISIGHVVQLGD